MIANPGTAEKISAILLDVASKIDNSILLVREECPTDEFKVYRRGAARILGEMLGILNSLYQQHPTMRPPGFGGDKQGQPPVSSPSET